MTQISTHHAGPTRKPLGTPAPGPVPRARKGAGRRLACATVRVARPLDLCLIQKTTRELCRSVGLDESSVFKAVISVTELAHRLFIEKAKAGTIAVTAVKRKRGLELEVRAGNFDDQDAPAAGFNMALALPAAPPYS